MKRRVAVGGHNAWFDDLTANRFPVPVRQENHYDPFGQNLEQIELASSFDSPQQYTGQEKSGDSGLNLYDYASRQYDVQLGRFTGMDAAAASYPAQGPYNYCLNNPVNQVDPDGRNPLINAMARGAMIGGYHSAHSGGSWLGGAINGAATATASYMAMHIGGGSFASRVAWGVGAGAAAGFVNDVVYQNENYSSTWQGAVIGGLSAAYGAWQESAKNNAEGYGYGTNDGRFRSLVQDANEGSDGINATKAQRALHFFAIRHGVPEARYIEPAIPNTSPYTTPTGDMYITDTAFMDGAATVKTALVHELGHYYDDINWSHGIIGGPISDPNHYRFNNREYLYDGDGPSGYQYTIRHAGQFHLSLSGMLNTTFGSPAWRAYNATKWFHLIPWH